ncbi:MAG: site-2 protease family protein [Frankiales bacterium]|nr:site-2 protease family protein [Frankiales bacterium]
MGDQGLRIGRVLGVPVFLTPSWFLFAAFTVLSYGPLLSQRFGQTQGFAAAGVYAVMLLASVLLHEIGHCVVARAFGLPVRSITVTLLAGLTEITSPPQTPAREYAVGVAGPMVSLLLGGLGYAGAELLDEGGLAWFLVRGIAVINAVLAVFNLLPGLPLDGGRVLRAAVWQATGDGHRATIVSAWAGRVLALVVVPLALLVVLPALGLGGEGAGSLVFTGLIASFIYVGATASLRREQMTAKLPGVTAGALARPALGVPADLPLAEAVRRANEVGARGLVVVGGAGRPEGVVSEAAVIATPEVRRPWIAVSALSRRVDVSMLLDPGLRGEDLLTAMRAAPAPEYVVRDAEGRLGVLVAEDVAKAVSP